MRSPTSWFSRTKPICQSIASTSVVSPWSTCATIATLRRSSRRAEWVVGTGREGSRACAGCAPAESKRAFSVERSQELSAEKGPEEGGGGHVHKISLMYCSPSSSAGSAAGVRVGADRERPRDGVHRCPFGRAARRVWRRECLIQLSAELGQHRTAEEATATAPAGSTVRKVERSGQIAKRSSPKSRAVDTHWSCRARAVMPVESELLGALMPGRPLPTEGSVALDQRPDPSLDANAGPALVCSYSLSPGGTPRHAQYKRYEH